MAIGRSALNANTTGASNVAVGKGALDANTSGAESVAVGIDAGGANTTGRIVAVGRHAVKSNTTAVENTGIGYRALRDTTTGANNTAVGGDALLLNTTGASNTAVGKNAASTNTTSNGITAVGENALSSTTGAYNTAIGTGAGTSITTGAKNTIIGGFQGNQDGLDIRTGSTYIVLSDGDGNARMYYNGANGGWRIGDINTSSSSTRGHNIWRGTYEGYHIIQGKSGSSGNTFQVYKETTLNFAVNVNGNVTNTNNSYGAISDIKLKQDIVDASSQWDDIQALQVRNFKFKTEVAEDGDNAKSYLGLIAQEAELISPNLIETVNDQTLDSEGEPVNTGTTTKQVKYSVLYMKAVKALQEAMTRIETLEAKVAALEGN